MNIAFYTVTILEHGGGFEKFLIDTANLLTEQYPDIHISILTHTDKFSERLQLALSGYYLMKFSPSKVHAVSHEETIRKLHPNVAYYKVKINNLRKELQKYDVVYAKNELLDTFFLKRIGYKHLPPVILSSSTAVHYPQAKSLHQKVHNVIYSSWVYKFLCSGIVRVHVKNAFDESFLKQLFPNKPVVKVLNTFDEKSFTAPNHHSKKKKVILWAGRLAEQKGLMDLVSLVNTINETRAEEVEWHIAGDGELRSLVEQLASKYKNIQYVGHLPHRLMPKFYGEGDMFISTSKWETFGNNILEAQAMGLPVISYDIPGPQDIVSPETGLLVNNEQEFLQALLNFISSKSSYKDVATITRKKFGKENVQNQLLQMFQGVATGEV